MHIILFSVSTPIVVLSYKIANFNSGVMH